MARGKRISYRSFEQARDFVRALGLRNKDEWNRYAKGELADKEPKPKDIPSRVDKIYKGKGWGGFDDFLGTKRNKEAKKNYPPFIEARDFARTLQLTSAKEWKFFCSGKYPELGKLPTGIPSNPEDVYRDKGWISYSDWLSEKNTPSAVVLMPFDEARLHARALKLNSIQDWEAYRNGERPDLGKCPDAIPVWPPHAYRDHGWSSWKDWLGLSFARRI